MVILSLFSPEIIDSKGIFKMYKSPKVKENQKGAKSNKILETEKQVDVWSLD